MRSKLVKIKRSILVNFILTLSPELNKNGKISQEQAEKYFKYFVVFLLLATFIILAIHVSIYGGALIFPPLM